MSWEPRQDPRWELSLSQQLSLQQLQSLNLLTFSLPELQQYLHHQVEHNPALEWPSRWHYFHPGDHYSTRVAKDQVGPDAWLAAQAGSTSLASHFLQQARMLHPWTDFQQHLAEWLVYNLDEHGFYRIDPYRRFVKKLWPQVREVERQLQQLEPVGCCCRDVFESLQVQGRAAEQAPAGLEQLLQRQWLEKLMLRQYRLVSQELGLELRRLRDLLEWIKIHLTPNPAASFSCERPQYLSPELSLRIENGAAVVEYHDDAFEVPVLSKGLLTLAPEEQDEQTRECMRQARKLCSALKQRKQTLLILTRTIIRLQPYFLEQGLRGLLELTGRRLAHLLGIHPSTVSRALAGKYIQTPHGLFALSQFCGTGVHCFATRLAREAVKIRLLELLRQGTVRRSDRELCLQLRQQGIDLQRRTITKYRSELVAQGRYP